MPIALAAAQLEVDDSSVALAVLHGRQIHQELLTHTSTAAQVVLDAQRTAKQDWVQGTPTTPFPGVTDVVDLIADMHAVEAARERQWLVSNTCDDMWRDYIKTTGITTPSSRQWSHAMAATGETPIPTPTADAIQAQLRETTTAMAWAVCDAQEQLRKVTLDATSALGRLQARIPSVFATTVATHKDTVARVLQDACDHLLANPPLSPPLPRSEAELKAAIHHEVTTHLVLPAMAQWDGFCRSLNACIFHRPLGLVLHRSLTSHMFEADTAVTDLVQNMAVHCAVRMLALAMPGKKKATLTTTSTNDGTATDVAMRDSTSGDYGITCQPTQCYNHNHNIHNHNNNNIHNNSTQQYESHLLCVEAALPRMAVSVDGSSDGGRSGL